ncbi:hypothetical protein GCM10010517_02160 [Streptosporangium fragile]|uniref:DUF3592 domain-containing protein n=1 Tax=Streptosporangium fragile TaxID=46186 RepID=A0ABN3VRD3_9ACTN
MGKVRPEAALRAGWDLVVVRGVVFLAAVAACWLLLGIVAALDIPVWLAWVLGTPLFIALAAGPIAAMMKISEDVPWALWALLPFLVVLGAMAIALPGDHYLSVFGERVTATVADREWVETYSRRSGRDQYYVYVLHGPDGQVLAEDFRTLHDRTLEVGAPVEMLVDPRGVVAPRAPAADPGFVRMLTWVSGGWIVLMTVVLSVMGELRRRGMRPKGSGGPGGSGRPGGAPGAGSPGKTGAPGKKRRRGR